MAKLSAKYELMVVFSLKNGEEAAKELVAKFKSKIEEAATLEEVNEWGKRKLAYIFALCRCGICCCSNGLPWTGGRID